jgi:hypothetical protein
MRIIVFVLSLCATFSFKMQCGGMHKRQTNLQMSAHPTPKVFIENSNVPSCVNCRYFIPTTHIHFMQNVPNLDQRTYRFASVCRESSVLCREDGRYYEEVPPKE